MKKLLALTFAVMVAGGALAVENALKVAFDWKAQKLGLTDYEQTADDLAVLHFRAAFHGRSGYTLSLTNTDRTKIAWFPKFPWPRVHNPAIELDLDGLEFLEVGERLECCFFVELGDGEADMDDDVVVELGLRHERETDLLDDAVEVDLAHAGTVDVVDLNDFAGDSETHFPFTSVLPGLPGRVRDRHRWVGPAGGSGPQNPTPANPFVRLRAT